MTPDFDQATALTTSDSLDVPAVTWHGRMTADFSIGPVPNGGYTAALQLRALLTHTGCSSASALTTHYYRPTIGDSPCAIRTEVLRTGRSTTHADATLTQDGKVRARTAAVLGDYPADELLLPLDPPRITGPEDCPERDAKGQGMDMTLMDSLEIRISPESHEPKSGEEVRIDGWVRFRDGRPNDALALALFVDSFPPAVLAADANVGWVPTIEMTTHIRSVARDGWIQGRISTANIRGGTLLESVKLWDCTGALVAEARQLALLRPPF